jgi:glycosyltransferase involved in cell wall biosynthesis
MVSQDIILLRAALEEIQEMPPTPIHIMPYLIGLAVFGLWPERRHPDLKKPIPLLQAITRLIVGGAQETVMYLTDLLDKERFQVEVLSGPQTGSEGSLIEEVRANGIPVTILPDMLREISPLHDIMALIKMTRFIRNKHYTIVHTNSSKAGIIGRLAARMAGTPIIVHTVHGWSFHEHMASWLRRLYITLERFAASFTDAMVVVADSDIDKGLQAGIGRPEQYHLIRSAISTEEFDPQHVNRRAVREELGIPLDAPVLGNVGRFSPPKNPFDWVEVAARVAKQMPECYYLLVGDGALRFEAEALVTEKQLSEQTIFTGLRRDVPEMLAAIDVFLLISQWEGLPRVIPQAMAMQVPVVATHVGGSAEAILHGETGYQCNYGDLDDLAAHCLKLLQDERLRTEMGQRGRRYAIQEFDVHRMTQQMMALYEELLVSRSS